MALTCISCLTTDFTGRLISKLLRWWPAIVLLFVVVLLIYKALKIGRAPDTGTHRFKNSENVDSWISNNSRGNLKVVARYHCCALLVFTKIYCKMLVSLIEGRGKVVMTVYASPSRINFHLEERKEVETMPAYPDICFAADDFDSTFDAVGTFNKFTISMPSEVN